MKTFFPEIYGSFRIPDPKDYSTLELSEIVATLLQEEAERKRTVRKAYLERNKERISHYLKEYYKETRGDRIRIATERYQANKHILNEKLCCEGCGRLYTFQNKKRHEQSKHHQKKTMGS
jgi:hypothetical protein